MNCYHLLHTTLPTYWLDTHKFPSQSNEKCRFYSPLTWVMFFKTARDHTLIPLHLYVIRPLAQSLRTWFFIKIRDIFPALRDLHPCFLGSRWRDLPVNPVFDTVYWRCFCRWLIEGITQINHLIAQEFFFMFVAQNCVLHSGVQWSGNGWLYFCHFTVTQFFKC